MHFLSHLFIYPLILISCVSFYTVQSQALLGGKIVRVKSDGIAVSSLRVKAFSELKRCTGVFVSENTLITAAHCFGHLLKTCLGSNVDTKRCKKFSANHKNYFTQRDADVWVGKRKIAGEFHIVLHSDYKSVHELNQKAYESTNEDVAMLILEKGFEKQKFLKVATEPPATGFSAWLYGAGMSKMKLFSSAKTGEAYNIEESVGRLRKSRFRFNRAPAGGLINSNAVVKGVPIKKNLFGLSVDGGSQVLSADSGGPLVYQNKIVGLVRNFTFLFDPESIHKYNGRQFQMKGQSIFTSLTTDSQKKFFDEAKKYGGKVNF